MDLGFGRGADDLVGPNVRDPRRDPALGAPSHDETLASVHPGDRQHVAAAFEATLRGTGGFEDDHRLITGDGTEPVLFMLSHIRIPFAPAAFWARCRTSPTRAAEFALRDAEERFRRAFDEAPIGMAVISADGRWSMRTRRWARSAGPHAMSLKDCACVSCFTQRMRMPDNSIHTPFAARLTSSPSSCGSFPPPDRRSTSLFTERSSATRPARTALLCQFQDVTERKRFEAQLQFMADHDPLTGLLNRRKFEAELDRHVAHVKRYGPEGALLVLDIDNFKSINDTLGHSAGDQLIVSIATRPARAPARLRHRSPGSAATSSRCCCPRPTSSEADAGRRGARDGGEPQHRAPRRRAQEGHDLDRRRDVQQRIEQLTGETILIEADLAMYDAKEAGRDRHAFYATSEHRYQPHQGAADMGQPDRAGTRGGPLRARRPADPRPPHRSKYASTSCCCECSTSDDDLIPPASFLYIAERFGLIAKLDEWVATHAIELIEQHPDLQLEVNISGRSLGDPAAPAGDR